MPSPNSLASTLCDGSQFPAEHDQGRSGFPHDAIPRRHLSDLGSGSTFRGDQRSGRSCYDVQVDIQDCDVNAGLLSGYLSIKGLTEDWPTLCTFFQGEIIGPHHEFLTRKWESTARIDLEHWSRFPAFSPYEKAFHEQGRLPQGSREGTQTPAGGALVHDCFTSDYVFMRWKEMFLVPDYRIKSISGASFAGFYYIMYQRSTGCIDGFYYHENSERYQRLTLKHVARRSFPAFEFA
ncbi:MAG: hypothetical protein SGCHY_002734 [Lobulomycetales sp.]